MFKKDIVCPRFRFHWFCELELGYISLHDSVFLLQSRRKENSRIVLRFSVDRWRHCRNSSGANDTQVAFFALLSLRLIWRYATR